MIGSLGSTAQPIFSVLVNPTSDLTGPEITAPILCHSQFSAAELNSNPNPVAFGVMVFLLAMKYHDRDDSDECAKTRHWTDCNKRVPRLRPGITAWPAELIMRASARMVVVVVSSPLDPLHDPNPNEYTDHETRLLQLTLFVCHRKSTTPKRPCAGPLHGPHHSPHTTKYSPSQRSICTAALAGSS